MDDAARGQRLSHGYRMVTPTSCAVCAAEPKGTGALHPSARLPQGCEHHADGCAASFFQSTLDYGNGRLAESSDDSGVRGLRGEIIGGLERTGLFVEHI